MLKTLFVARSSDPVSSDCLVPSPNTVWHVTWCNNVRRQYGHFCATLSKKEKNKVSEFTHMMIYSFKMSLYNLFIQPRHTETVSRAKIISKSSDFYQQLCTQMHLLD